jgi:hypothetical protein
MDFEPSDVTRLFALAITMTTMLVFGCSGLGGPDIKILPNDYSRGLAATSIEADREQCKQISDAVLDEYGPHPPYSDNAFDDAAKLRGYLKRYAAACMRAKGYDVTGRFGVDIRPAELPASAIAKARGESK